MDWRGWIKQLHEGFRKLNYAKIAKRTALLYTLSLTALVIAFITLGPLNEVVSLLAKNRVLKIEIRDQEKTMVLIEGEKQRLLTALKILQADSVTQKETIEGLRRLVENPNVSGTLSAAEGMVEKLEKERRVLIDKVAELNGQVEEAAKHCSPGKSGQTPSAEMSDLIRKLEAEKDALKAEIRRLKESASR